MATLGEIRDKVRRLTASGPSQLSDAQIDTYINTYYTSDFPQQLRILKLQENYELTLERGKAIYPIPWEQYSSFSGPAYIFGYPIWISQSQAEFYNQFPLYDTQAFVQGNGTTGPFTTSGGPTNINPGTVVVFAVDENGATLQGRDDAEGSISGSLTGTVNYATGVISVSSPTIIPSTEQVSFQFNAMQWTRPNSLLIWDTQFVVRATPDQPYLLQLQAYRLPTTLIDSSSEPLLDQWWQALAFGAAKKIFEDRLDVESQAKVVPMLKEQLQYLQRSTLMQLAEQRPWTPYSRQLAAMTGSGAAGPGYGWWFGG
jgi:hypothetical protein